MPAQEYNINVTADDGDVDAMRSLIDRFKPVAVAEAAASAAQAALYDGVWLANSAAIETDETLSYGPGASGVSEGDTLQTREDRFSFRVLAEDADPFDKDTNPTGYHRINMNGVKLEVLPGADGRYNSDSFGVPTDEITDCAAPMLVALNAALGSTLVIPARRYVWATGGNTVTLTDNLTVICDGAEFYNGHGSATTLKFEAETVASPSMSGAIVRGGMSLTVDSTAGISKGDLIAIVNPDIWETDYNYRKREVHIVNSASGTTITLARPVLFGHDSGAFAIELNVYAPRKLKILGELTCTYPDSAGGTGRVIDIAGLLEPEVDGLRLIDPQRRMGPGPDVFFVQWSHGLRLRNVFADGARYPVNISNGSWDTAIDTVHSQFNHHPIDFNNGASKGVVRNITGYRNTATVNTHPAFEISYENAYCLEGSSYNHRSVGGDLVNFTYKSSQSLGTVYIQNVALVDDVYDEYDTRQIDCNIEHPNGDLSPQKNPRNIYQTRCKAATMSHGLSGNSNRFMTNCETHFLKHRGSAMHVSGLRLVYDWPGMDVADRLDWAIDIQNATAHPVTIKGLSATGGYPYLLRNTQFDALTISDFWVEDIATDLSSNFGGSKIKMANGVFKDCTLPMTSYTSKALRTSNVELSGGSGKAISQKRGRTTATTDANGNISISHGLYDAPNFAQVKVLGDVAYEAMVQSISATSITVRIASLTDGTDIASTGVTVMWEAEI